MVPTRLVDPGQRSQYSDQATACDYPEFESWQGLDIFLFSKVAVGPPCILFYGHQRLLRWQRLETDRSCTSSAEVKNEWGYAFMACTVTI